MNVTTQRRTLPHLVKGYWLTHVEEYLNAGPDALRSCLAELRSGRPLRASTFVANDRERADPRFGPYTSRELANEWFGSAQQDLPIEDRDQLRGPGGFEERLRALLSPEQQQRFDRLVPIELTCEVERVRQLATAAVELGLSHPFPTVGRWHNYFGDVEQIVRVTFRSAIELALGIGSDDPPDAAIGPPLPIEVLWSRPHPWAEGWVLARDNRPDSGNVDHVCGSVTIVLATPPTGPMIARPSAPFTKTPLRAWAEQPEPGDPVPASAGIRNTHRSMLRIGHANNVALPPINSRRETARGDWVVPEPGCAYVGVGAVLPVPCPTISGGLNPYARSTASVG